MPSLKKELSIHDAISSTDKKVAESRKRADKHTAELVQIIVARAEASTLLLHELETMKTTTLPAVPLKPFLDVLTESQQGYVGNFGRFVLDTYQRHAKETNEIVIRQTAHSWQKRVILTLGNFGKPEKRVSMHLFADVFENIPGGSAQFEMGDSKITDWFNQLNTFQRAAYVGLMVEGAHRALTQTLEGIRR